MTENEKMWCSLAYTLLTMVLLFLLICIVYA